MRWQGAQEIGEVGMSEETKYKGWVLIQMSDSYWIARKRSKGVPHRLAGKSKAELKVTIDRRERAGSVFR